MNRYYRPSNRRRFERKFNKSSAIDTSFFIKKAEALKKEEEYIPTLKYTNLNINETLKQNVLSKGYTLPTPIQDKAIGPILQGKDIVGVAATGTGKTAAFLIPLIEKIIRSKEKTEKILILIPTRELATQINAEFRALSQNTNIYSIVCIGGTNINAQIRSFRYPYNFIIATPGRLKDLYKRGVAKLNNVKYVVLDEVDRMFDMGFGNDIRFLLEEIPTPRQNLFFSATISPNIEQLFSKYLVNPEKVQIASVAGVNNIEQNVVRVPEGKTKIDILHDLLIKDDFSKVLVFGKTKWGVKSLHQQLEYRGFKVESIHGNKTQAQRQKSLNLFKESRVNILVATDVAARGIDVKDISHVINYDLPATREDYIHRIGRTGRANKTGVALTFI